MVKTACFCGVVDTGLCVIPVLFSPWVDHVREFWERRNDENILFITYEDLAAVGACFFFIITLQQTKG